MEQTLGPGVRAPASVSGFIIYYSWNPPSSVSLVYCSAL